MEGAGQSGGGPAPFLLKTYDMVDDSSTDDIVSWSSAKNSFVVWNPPEFSRHLLPTYFKHNNFSSFIRQLNTYGFRKIDPERWEFANEEFLKDRKDLLKNIHRRKPIHSHSQPLSSFGETERIALEEEIDRLSREKSALQSDLLRFKQQQSGTLAQLEALERRVHEMELRQLKMMSFLAKAVNNPTFVEHLIRMAGTSFDFSAINKKRRLPKVDFCQEVVENSFIDNNSSTSNPDFGHIFHEDFSNKLKLELSSTVSDSNLLSMSAHSSTEDEETPHKSPEGDPEGSYMRTEGLCFATKTLELSDTGTSFSAQKNGFPLLRQMSTNECPEGEGLISCQLNLTLASSLLQVDRAPQLSVEERCISAEPRTNPNNNEAEDIRIAKNRGFSENNATMLSSQGGLVNNIQGPVAAPGRVNDVFWEQFLTERPGSSDTEEASSSFRAHPYDEQEERKAGTGKLWRDKKDMEQLTL